MAAPKSLHLLISLAKEFLLQKSGLETKDFAKK